MIELHFRTSHLTSHLLPFLEKEDMATKISKVVLSIIDSIFQAFEKVVQYLQQKPKPKPFYVRYRPSWKVLFIALAFFGLWKTTQFIQRLSDYVMYFPDKLRDSFEGVLPFPKSERFSDLYEKAADQVRSLKDHVPFGEKLGIAKKDPTIRPIIYFMEYFIGKPIYDIRIEEVWIFTKMVLHFSRDGLILSGFSKSIYEIGKKDPLVLFVLISGRIIYDYLS